MKIGDCQLVLSPVLPGCPSLFSLVVCFTKTWVCFSRCPTPTSTNTDRLSQRNKFYLFRFGIWPCGFQLGGQK